MHTLSILLSLYVSPPLPPHVFTASPAVGPVFSSLWALKISTSRERQIYRERKRDSHAGFYYTAFLTCETSCKFSLRMQTAEPLCTCSHINKTFLMRVCVPVGLIRLNGSCVMTSSAVTQYVLTWLSTSLVKITIFTCDQYIYLFTHQCTCVWAVCVCVCVCLFVCARTQQSIKQVSMCSVCTHECI